MDRRTFLRYGTAGVLLPGAVAGALAGRSLALIRHRSPAVRRFAVPLPVPPVLRPTSTAGGVDEYDVTQRAGEASILPGRPTRIWGYDGIFPGPTIEARRGRPVVVRHRNELPVPTVVHLHGGVVPPEHDGFPTDLLLPAGTHAAPGHHGGRIAHGVRAYRYPNDQPAATLWYHDHRMDFTGPQVYRGLAGLYLVRDDVEDGLPLPRGDREVPLVIADRFLHEDGSLFYPSLDPTLLGRPGVDAMFSDGVRGDTVLVNGAPWPFHRVDAARHRLRILNASNASAYELRLDPPPPGGGGLVQIGSDAGLLAAPVPLDSLLIGPGERYDVIVDFGRYRPGTSVTLGGLVRFDVGSRVADDSSIPLRLAPDLEPAGTAVTTRSFRFLGGAGGLPSTVNLRTYRPDRVDARPRLGTTEIWNLSTDPEHPIHLHLGQFRILDRGGAPPTLQDGGWKDTVLIRGGSARIAVRFTGFRGRYVFHCHNLEHEDMMMMANLEVV